MSFDTDTVWVAAAVTVVVLAAAAAAVVAAAFVPVAGATAGDADAVIAAAFAGVDAFAADGTAAAEEDEEDVEEEDVAGGAGRIAVDTLVFFSSVITTDVVCSSTTFSFSFSIVSSSSSSSIRLLGFFLAAATLSATGAAAALPPPPKKFLMSIVFELSCSTRVGTSRVLAAQLCLDFFKREKFFFKKKKRAGTPISKQKSKLEINEVGDTFEPRRVLHETGWETGLGTDILFLRQLFLNAFAALGHCCGGIFTKYYTIMADAEVAICSNPGCDRPGTSSCAACKTTVYCCVVCQTADWAHHKEECQGHLRKVGEANLEKAKGFHRERNWVQALRYADLAATKLKKLKDRRLETVEAINDALSMKFDALNFMARHREAMACAEECYSLWAMNQMRNPGSIRAALGLIESCIHNEEYEDAEYYARHAMFMINDMADNFIPSDQRAQFLADGSRLLALAIFWLTKAGGIPPEEEKKAGEEAIVLARQALKIHTQLHGTANINVAMCMGTLATILDYFNDVNDDEILRLYEQTNAINRRAGGISSVNVAAGEGNLGLAYESRAKRALAASDLDQCLANLVLALPHFRESARTYSSINRLDDVDRNLRDIARVEENIRQTRIARAAAATATAAAAKH